MSHFPIVFNLSFPLCVEAVSAVTPACGSRCCTDDIIPEQCQGCFGLCASLFLFFFLELNVSFS